MQIFEMDPSQRSKYFALISETLPEYSTLLPELIEKLEKNVNIPLYIYIYISANGLASSKFCRPYLNINVIFSFQFYSYLGPRY